MATLPTWDGVFIVRFLDPASVVSGGSVAGAAASSACLATSGAGFLPRLGVGDAIFAGEIPVSGFCEGVCYGCSSSGDCARPGGSSISELPSGGPLVAGGDGVSSGPFIAVGAPPSSASTVP